MASIKIIEGPFQGVIYHYSVVKILDEDDSGNIPLQFTYNIVSDHKFFDDELKDFEGVTASVLYDLITMEAERVTRD